MLQSVRISSKRQITIPSRIYQSLNLKKGDQLLVELKEDKIFIQKAQAVLDQLAGSLKIPSSLRKKNLETIIKEAKEKYFKNKKR